jgi:predicted membrane channel-forming protein YqfA (hemolysin III family)
MRENSPPWASPPACRLKYHHAVWHLFVLAGTACHFVAVYGHLS